MISIIIPVFNQAEYLPDAIESAMEQLDVEIIIVDDGSTDGSGEIADRYARASDRVPHIPQERIKVIHQVNKGLSSARNTGIMNAKGDYILPLDGDDILLPNCTTEIQEVINKTGADIVAPSFKEFGLRNQEIILMSNPSIDDFRTANRIGYFSAIKKEALLQVGGYSPRMMKGYEDYHLWFDLLKRGKKLVTIAKILVLYRVRENSMITESVKHHEELIAQINKDHAK